MATMATMNSGQMENVHRIPPDPQNRRYRTTGESSTTPSGRRGDTGWGEPSYAWATLLAVMLTRSPEFAAIRASGGDAVRLMQLRLSMPKGEGLHKFESAAGEQDRVPQGMIPRAVRQT